MDDVVDLENPAVAVDDDPTFATAEPDEASTVRALVGPAVALCVIMGLSYLLVRLYYSSSSTIMAAVLGILGGTGLVVGGLGCLALFAEFLCGNSDGKEQIELQQDRSR